MPLHHPRDYMALIIAQLRALQAARRKMNTQPINPAAHDFLLANGYSFTHHCTFEDDGDAESGPDLTGGEWDEYESAEDRIFINAYDGAADFEALQAARR